MLLEIDGDPDSIRTMASWLGDKLSQSVQRAVHSISAAGSESSIIWEGESGIEFRLLCGKILDKEPDTEQFTNDVAEVFRAYAGRLERGREKFDRLLDYARQEKLEVIGREILSPITALLACPAENASQEDVDQWNLYARKTGVYREIAREVGKWFGEQSTWAAEHFLPLAARSSDQSEFAKFFDALAIKNADVLQGVGEFSKTRLVDALADMRVDAAVKQEIADQFRKQLNSGNPALRAAAQQADHAGMKAEISLLNDRIAVSSRFQKSIPIGGVLVDIVSAVAELRNGASHTSVGAGILGGSVGASVGVGLVEFAGSTFVVGGPIATPVAVASASVGGAILTGAAAVWLWEAAVPLDIRETIDAGIARSFEVVFSASY